MGIGIPDLITHKSHGIIKMSSPVTHAILLVTPTESIVTKYRYDKMNRERNSHVDQIYLDDDGEMV